MPTRRVDAIAYVKPWVALVCFWFLAAGCTASGCYVFFSSPRSLTLDQHLHRALSERDGVSIELTRRVVLRAIRSLNTIADGDDRASDLAKNALRQFEKELNK